MQGGRAGKPKVEVFCTTHFIAKTNYKNTFFLPGQPSPACDFASVLLSQQQPYLLATVAHLGRGTVIDNQRKKLIYLNLVLATF